MLRRIPLLRLLTGLLVLLAFLAVGEVATTQLGIPVPGSVVGMVLLAAGLQLGIVPLALVRSAAELLVRHMALLFVPPGVGLMLYFGLIRAEWPAITAAAVAGTLAVLLVVGFIQQRMGRHG